MLTRSNHDALNLIPNLAHPKFGSSQIWQNSPIAAQKSAVVHSPDNAIVIICAIFRVQFVARELPIIISRSLSKRGFQ
jgi:hypothetical protein